MCVCVVTNGDEKCSLSMRQGLLESLKLPSEVCLLSDYKDCSKGGDDAINRSLNGLEKRTIIIIDLQCILQQAQDYM